MNAFTTIHDNFVTLLENTVVPYVADKYRESQAIDLKSVKTSDPASIWNRAYSIQAKGMNGVTELFNNLGYLEYDIVLQLAYELSYQGDKTKYNTANDEVATIIQKRIAQHRATGTARHSRRRDSDRPQGRVRCGSGGDATGRGTGRRAAWAWRGLTVRVRPRH